MIFHLLLFNTKLQTMSTLILLLLLLLSTTTLSSPTFTSFSKTTSSSSHETASSPLTAKASTIRYWNRKLTNNLPLPPFLLSKLSPLSPIQLSTFTTHLSKPNLRSFCSSANILCSTTTTTSDLDHRSSSSSSSHSGNFTSYLDSNFTTYATEATSLANSFSQYSPDNNLPTDTFRQYSRTAIADTDSFSKYSLDGNVVTSNFTSYSTSAAGGTGDFSAYHSNANVPHLKFTNYDTDTNGPHRTFATYTDDTNSGDESFGSYGKRGNGVDSTFASYAKGSNVIDSDFSGYGEDGNGANDTFSSYGKNGNVPENKFESYGENGNGGADGFNAYRNRSNVGDDTFSSYGKSANGEQTSFARYGESFNEGSDKFKNYGEGSFDDDVNFTSYSGDNTDFKAYANAKSGNTFTFATYVNSSGESKRSNKWAVEPGKFFRESGMTKGTVMPMPDIRDRMPSRSFLPRSVANQIPFSAAEINRIFGIATDTAMGKAVGDTVAECERAPSKGETKKCATSAEDMIDFAVEVLGSDVVPRTTRNTKGSGGIVIIGEVKGINGGNVTESVSCHQSLFPFLVYYCHSVPKVRVYEAEILDGETKEKINEGVVICHLDTSDWSGTHGAFVSLGSAPGKIEVCHWIFEGDMTWAVAD